MSNLAGQIVGFILMAIGAAVLLVLLVTAWRRRHN